MNAGEASRERTFCYQFADFIGVHEGIATTNGSSALTAALTAAGVGYGDEVLVPALVWVACASAVARIGAVPIMVDLDEETYAMDPVDAEGKITPRTVAILVTHLASSIADLDAFDAIARRHHLLLIEDCSQAHGAMWRGRRVGSFGSLAAFSFQSSKLLTAGEGGIVVTDDPDLARRAQHARADGREWAREQRSGFPDLIAGGAVQGHNHCMTEVQAAILSASLADLDHQNALRRTRVAYFESQLAGIDGVTTLRRRGDDRVDAETFWHLPVQINSECFGGQSAEEIRTAVSDDVRLYLEPVGLPLHRHLLYRPLLYRRFPPEHVAKLDTSCIDVPNSTRLAATCFTVPHHAFLGDTVSLDRLIDSIRRRQHRSEATP